MVGPEGRGELALPGLDRLPPGRPRREQGRVDPVDLPHRALALRSGAVGEADAEALDEAGLEVGVVVLGRHHLGLEQHPPVQGQPPPALLGQGLHLV
nr:hypothetical protein [Ornithinimicrobium sp. HY006]